MNAIWRVQVHFDLKSPNVLLGRQHVAKIADVGLAKILQKDYVSSLQSVGTFAWSVRGLPPSQPLPDSLLLPDAASALPVEE